MTMDAPYNFAPLSDAIYIPEWGGRVSHDLPFADGLSGEIAYTLEAHTPLLVGQERKQKENAPAEVFPFRAPDGRYGIPGSSLRGMIRAVLEVAAFGRMGSVDDGRFALRDISGKHVKKIYGAPVENVRAGLLYRDADTGLPRLEPCEYAKVTHDSLGDYATSKKPVFKHGMSVNEKYAQWSRLMKSRSDGLPEVSFNCRADTSCKTAEADRHGDKRGLLVLTGQISDPRKAKGKKNDFIFYDESPNAEAVLPEDWNDFLFVHTPPNDKDRADKKMSWPSHWERHYFSGGKVPVFYLRRPNGRLRIGLARLPRLAGDYSVHDAIRATNEAHLAGQADQPDLPSLLFGHAEPEGALKGRVDFEPAFIQDERTPDNSAPLILAAPKPGFFPAYLEQTGAVNGKLRQENTQYITYLGDKGRAPRIRGWKRYPARQQAAVPPLAPEQQANPAVQSVLKPLPAGSRFHGRVVFHNLRPEELGALVWALTWGGRPECRHGLGMGKPFGYGAVSITLESGPAPQPNAPDTAPPTLEQCRQRFEAEMGRWSRRTIGEQWERTGTVTQLLGMADPANAELRYPTLSEYQGYKKTGSVLPPYVALAKQTEAAPLAHRDRVVVDTSDAGGQWLRDTIDALSRELSATDYEVLRGKPLAAAWEALEDPAFKALALEAIIRTWQKVGYWEAPPSKGARRIKQIYEQGLSAAEGV